MEASWIVMFVLVGLALATGIHAETTSPNGQARMLTDFSVVFEALEYREGVTKEYIHWDFARIGLYVNETKRLYVLNANFTIKKDLPSTAWITVIAYELMSSNKYSMIPIKLADTSLCNWVDTDTIIYKDLTQHSNLLKACPYVKGDYFIKDYMFNKEYISDLSSWVGRRFKVTVTIKDKKHGEPAILKMTIKIVISHPV